MGTRNVAREFEPSRNASERRAVETHNAAAVARAAHALKGAVANFGANHRAFGAAVALELCGNSGDLTEIQHLFAEVTKALGRLQSEMCAFSEKALYSRRRPECGLSRPNLQHAVVLGDKSVEETQGYDTKDATISSRPNHSQGS